MTEEECLLEFGLNPSSSQLERIRELLVAEVEQEELEEEGDMALIKLLCYQLFRGGLLQDSLLIWRAKSSSFDNHCSVDVQLLCGAGVSETVEYLHGLADSEADAALEWIRACQAAGDFVRFEPGEFAATYAAFYGGLGA